MGPPHILTEMGWSDQLKKGRRGRKKSNYNDLTVFPNKTLDLTTNNLYYDIGKHILTTKICTILSGFMWELGLRVTRQGCFGRILMFNSG